MRKMKKFLALTACAAMLVAASVMGTMAYLTSQDEAVNTFTVGNVKIHLDEVDTDDAEATTYHKWCDICKGTERDHANAYHLLPGIPYEKDPTVTVLANSEESYVRMMVQVEKTVDGTAVDAIAALKRALPQFVNDDGIFLLQMLCVDENGNNTWDSTNWKYVNFYDSTDSKYPNTYEFRYASTVPKSSTNTELSALFTDITVPGNTDNDSLAYLEGISINVSAHAIQKAGFANANEAWEAFD